MKRSKSKTVVEPKKEKVVDFVQLQKNLDNDEDMLEIYDALKDVTLFENKMSNKNENIMIKKPIIDKSIIAKYRAFESPILEPTPTKYLVKSQPVSRCLSPVSHSRSNSPKRCSKYCSACNPEKSEKNKVLATAPFNVVDAPLELTPKRPHNYYTKPINENPWYSDFQKDNSNGIPYFSSAYKRSHEKKIENYEQMVRYQLTMDQRKKEIMMKKRKNQSCMAFKKEKEKTANLILKSGQGWCLQALERKKLEEQRLRQKPRKVDPFDMEAIREAEMRDKQIREAEKEKILKSETMC